MSISSVGTPTQQQVPEILWSRGPEPTERRDQANDAAAATGTPPTPTAAAQPSEPPPEPDYGRAPPPENQGRLVDRTV
jgi:hypothetical protein